MLYPLVELCLPEDLIRVWIRSKDFLMGENVSWKRRLHELILFISTVVESEERITMSMDGFGLGRAEISKKSTTKILEKNFPSVAGLLNCET